MSTIEIRQATKSDLDGIVASSAGLFAEDAATRDPTMNPDWPKLHGREAYARDLADPAHVILLAVTDAGVIGHLCGVFIPASDIRTVNSASLISMYVFSDHRRAGVGARLVAALVDWARDRSATRLTVQANTVNTEAIDFYRDHGFEPQYTTLQRML